MTVCLEGLTKSFGPRPAVVDLTLTIADGGIFGLLGHNGAGKSTTFGMMLGMVAPDRGEVLLGGHSVQRERSRALAHVGAIFETPAFYDYLSGWDNLQFLVSLCGRPVPRSEFEGVISLVGLTERIHDPVRAYSHGMRQRLGLAQALLPRPEFLLLDEPTDGLDPLGIVEMRGMIRHLRDEMGITVMLSSHLLPEVEQLCDRIAILHEGRLAYEGTWTSTRNLWKFSLDPPERAQVLLAEAGLVLRGESWEAPVDFDPAPVVARLVRAGIAVREVHPVRRTLEDFYQETVGR